MRYFALGVLLFALCGLSGCPNGPVRMADLEWDPPRLSKEDCPNLSGTYKDRGTLHQVFTVGLQKSLSETSDEEPVARAKVLRNIAGPTRTADEFYARYRAFEQRAILQIRHDPDVLQAVLMDEAGVVYQEITVRLDTPRTGCHSGALILRKKTVYGKGEGSSGSVDFGEDEIRKLPDGSLEVVSRNRYQARSVLTGAPVGPIRIDREVKRVYPISRPVN